MTCPGADSSPDLQAAIDEDHRALARQIEKMAQICARSPEECRCTQCPPATFDACETTLFDVTGKVLSLMLDHFDREDEMMRQLPRTVPVMRHCEAHREAHVDFSSRYNKLTMSWEYGDVVSSIRAWQNFIHDWSHHHAREYDKELTRLTRSATAS